MGYPYAVSRAYVFRDLWVPAQFAFDQIASAHHDSKTDPKRLLEADLLYTERISGSHDAILMAKGKNPADRPD